MSVEPIVFGPAALSVIGIRSVCRTVCPATVTVHAYTGPEVAGGTAGVVTMICTVVVVVVVSVQLNAASVVPPTRVTLSAVGAWIDTVPAVDGIAEPVMLTAGICVAVPAAMVVWPVRATVPADSPADWAAPAAVTLVRTGSRALTAAGSCMARVVSVTAVAVPTVPWVGALSPAVRVTAVLVVASDRVHE
jgi:hypothetical protein